MVKKVSIYFTPVDGCNNTLCHLFEWCDFSPKEMSHMDINLLNYILRDCYLHINNIERLYLAVLGNSQAYIHAGDIDLGGFSSKFTMSYTYPYPIDNYPTNICKMYRIDTRNEVEYLMTLPDFWNREITKLYTVVSKKNYKDLPYILRAVNELRRKRTFLYTINSIRRAPEVFVNEEAILPLLENYQYVKMEDDHLTSCRKVGPNITVDHLGRAQLHWTALQLSIEEQGEAFNWTNFNDVYRRVLEIFNTSEKCASCLRTEAVEWRYAIL